MKYVALSATCAGCATFFRPAEASSSPMDLVMINLLWYGAVVNAFITFCMVARRWEWILGKDLMTGSIPFWSYLLFAAFFAPSWLYTWIHAAISERHGVPVASEVVPGWWIGGCFASRLKRRWAATIDLTCEFPEGCRETTDAYLLLRCWDGTPPSPQDIERAARFAAEHTNSKSGGIIVHCAHGRGRSTCVMLACLVRSGVYSDWRTAFEAVRLKRKGVMLNSKMRRALQEWEAMYD